MSLPSNFFCYFFDLKSMSFKFVNDISIIFEMPRSSFIMSIGEMNIWLLFRPSASEVLDSSNIENANPNLYCTWCMEEMTHVHLQASQPMTLFLLDTIQDFLIKLGIKPCMHFSKISISSLNNVIIKPTKIMKRADKNCTHF